MKRLFLLLLLTGILYPQDVEIVPLTKTETLNLMLLAKNMQIAEQALLTAQKNFSILQESVRVTHNAVFDARTRKACEGRWSAGTTIINGNSYYSQQFDPLCAPWHFDSAFKFLVRGQ